MNYVVRQLAYVHGGSKSHSSLIMNHKATTKYAYYKKDHKKNSLLLSRDFLSQRTTKNNHKDCQDHKVMFTSQLIAFI